MMGRKVMLVLVVVSELMAQLCSLENFIHFKTFVCTKIE